MKNLFFIINCNVQLLRLDYISSAFHFIFFIYLFILKRTRQHFVHCRHIIAFFQRKDMEEMDAFLFLIVQRQIKSLFSK